MLWIFMKKNCLIVSQQLYFNDIIIHCLVVDTSMCVYTLYNIVYIPHAVYGR
jgi:hypothetical protein